MPRISRTSVQFNVNNAIYLASFSHQHFEPPQKVDGLKLRHITKCSLYGDCSLQGNSALLAEGTAMCSKKDVYTWLYGVRVAFSMTVLQMLAGDGKTPTRCRGGPSSLLNHTVEVGGKYYVILSDVERELWGKFHKGFFTEMRKAPAMEAT